MNERYLWDKSGERDPEIERLETLLARFRHAPTAEPELPVGAQAAAAPDVAVESVEVAVESAEMQSPSEARVSRAKQGLVLAAAAAAMVCVWLFLGPEEPVVRGYRVVGLEGNRLVRAGEEVATGDERAEMKIAELGHVAVEPQSRVRVDDCGELAHRLYLERGSIHAQILGDPREFQVGTPAGLTVDLGCEYTLAVAPDGRALLEVLTGQVAFEFEGRSVYVPAGAACVSTPDRGPGLPLFEDSTREFKQAVAAVESRGALDSVEQAAALFEGTREDTLTLWHLFDDPRTPPELVTRAFARLSRVFPKPEGVTDGGLLSGDRGMRAAWMEAMKPSWRVQ
jgi:hypothetical protein